MRLQPFVLRKSLRSRQAPARQPSFPPVELLVRGIEQFPRRPPVFRIHASPDTYAYYRLDSVIPNASLNAMRNLLGPSRLRVNQQQYKFIPAEPCRQVR
jgi:hypothetical protein